MSAHCWRIVALLVVAVAGTLVHSLPPSCDSPIYCYGELLYTVQVKPNPPFYDDSKKFVDMRMKYSPNEVLQNFEDLKAREGGDIPQEELLKFVNDNFEDGNELEAAVPGDWKESPAVLNRIADPDLRQWAKELNALWKNLTRRVNDDVKQNADRYSLLYVPNNFIVPGGRFRELYYWDTYWIVRGLLLSEMTSTVKGIIGNFVYMLENYGIIPNGGRVYYLQRSQPPTLTPMVANYYVATKDVEYVRSIIGTLDKEFQFWMDNRTVEVQKDGKTYTLARYFSPSEGPRPESYREDYEIAHKTFDTDERRQQFYEDIKSAAESGWDFSSRWFIRDGSNNGTLSDIHTRNVIPVDLNAFLFWNARILSDFHKMLGDFNKAAKYTKIASDWKEAVTAVLWNEDEGSWFDYDTLNNKQREYFYPSNVAPLWTKCYDESRAAIIGRKVVNYLDRSNIRSYLGGIPTSVNRSGEQWDLPNAWPPLQSIVVQGLDETNEKSAKDLAYELAKQWVRSNYRGYQDSMEMYEKYDAENPGKYGGGGEYTVQSGFGWTNGVVMEFLATYGERLTANGNNKHRRRSLWNNFVPRGHGGK
ncbi:trehalase [Anabrus simplex]|uniref:trehalase n=1 Tax=Anabrus simplex TaxID=316456 RepID=UPI0035A31FC0